ncbi:MAG: pseudouridine synthase [Segetibacter sp.]|nr:pseudouridine synthase [Segetibacter sp.]
MDSYFVIYKPYLVLSQFTSQEGKETLAHHFNVPKEVYPVGRLDYDSEGLLILTNDKQLNNRLLNPMHQHEREYWVQVEGTVTEEALKNLQQGLTISIDGKPFKTAKSKALILTPEPNVPVRNPPIRYRKNIATSWISLSLTEGKNRQVRRMTAAVGFPTLRLIRYRIEKVTIEGLQPGEIKELSKEKLYGLLFH